MRADALIVIATVLGGGATVIAVVRFEARRRARRMDLIARAAGIEAPDDAGRRAVAHETGGLVGGERQSMRESKVFERGNGRDIEVERTLASLSGLRTVREPEQ